MANWKIGDVTITRIVEFEGALPTGGKGTMVEKAFPEALQKIEWLQPHFSTAEGHAKMAVQALLLETPTHRIVVDTCVGNDKPRANPFFNNLQTAFLKDMEAAGWTRDSVDIVLCTHLHVDHVGWNTMLVDGKWVPTFPNARYLVGAREWTHWQTEKDNENNTALLSDSVQPIFDAGLADLIEDNHLICPEVSVRPTPGHTPGHISVTISSKGENAVITGDLMHHPCQIANPSWSSGFDTDQHQADKTRAAFLAEMADSGTLVIGTHFATPAGGQVISDGSSYRLKID
jgi:glyoxylase-like metal-dependent hydrolase (beta-lactamase superfamily II)